MFCNVTSFVLYTTFGASTKSFLRAFATFSDKNIDVDTLHTKDDMYPKTMLLYTVPDVCIQYNFSEKRY